MLKKTIILTLFSTLAIGCNAQKSADTQTAPENNEAIDDMFEDLEDADENDIPEQEPVLDYTNAKQISGADAIEFATTCPYDQCIRPLDSLDDAAKTAMNSLALPTIRAIFPKDRRSWIKMKIPEVTGNLDKRIIEKIVRHHRDELRSCYEKELEKTRGIKGHIVANWVITPVGQVSDAGIHESTLANENLENCIVNSIKNWRFPAPKGGGTVSVHYPIELEDPNEPLQLILSRYNVDAQITGNYAKVKTEFTITNKDDAQYGGSLNFPLPDNAVITNYAIDIGNTMEEARAVEKEQATYAFENEVNPGLVEQTGKNTYRVRISPIPKQGQRHIRVEYTTPLTQTDNGESVLVLPMPEDELDPNRTIEDPIIPAKPMLGKGHVAPDSQWAGKARNMPEDKAPAFSLKVKTQNTPFPVLTGINDVRFEANDGSYTLNTQDIYSLSTGNVLITIPKMPNVVTAIEKSHGEYFFSVDIDKLEPSNETDLKSLPKNWRILWDASGSRTQNAIDKAKQFIQALPEDATYTLYVFRNALEPEKTFSSRAELLTALDAVDYDGGTNFKPLAAITKQAFDGKTLMFTDGLDSINDKLPQLESFTAILSGETTDDLWMNELSLGNVINLNRMNAEAAVKELRKASRNVKSLNGKDISQIQGLGQRTSGHISLIGRMKEPTDKALLTLSDGTQYQVNFDTTKVYEGQTLSSQWAKKRVNTLSVRSTKSREELLAISKQFNIVTPLTSLITLENLNQWLLYDIEPPETSQFHDAWIHYSKQKWVSTIDDVVWMSNLTKQWNKRISWWNENQKAPVVEQNIPQPADDSQTVDAAPTPSAQNAEPHIEPMNNRQVNTAPNAERDWNIFEEQTETTRTAPGLGGFGPSGGGAGVGGGNGVNNNQSPTQDKVEAKIRIMQWNSDMPYIKAIQDTETSDHSKNEFYNEYLRQRKTYAHSPAFYFDCASIFFEQNDREHARRILSNLTEMGYEDPAILRPYAWRLREAGILSEAIRILRKIAALEPKSILSWRDLALTLTMRAQKTNSAKDAQEALELYKKAAFTPTNRDSDVLTAVVALEEFNELAAWCKRQEWDKPPIIPEIDEPFQKVLDTDLRIVITWDVDQTDLDVHVTEPSSEEIYYGNRRSKTGAMLSDDIRSGYGPEEYLHRHAPKGTYTVSTKYYASHQTKLIGPANITATFYSNWGRPTQKSESVTVRLNKPDDKILIGSYEVK